jgi:hypothetical protein
VGKQPTKAGSTAMTASQSPTEYVRQLLERLRPDRRMSLAICLGAAACFGLSYYDALTDMELRDTTLPPNAVRRLPDGRLLLRDGSIIGK